MKLQFYILMLAIALITSCALHVMAEEIEEPIQDVFKTELVYPQEKGEAQFTISPEYITTETCQQILVPVSFEYGITHALQAEIEWIVLNQINPDYGQSQSGAGDLELGLKYSLMNIAQNIHTAIGIEVKLPTGNEEKGLSDGTTEYEPYFLAAKDFPKFNNSQLFAQIAAGFSSSEDDSTDSDSESELAMNLGCFIPLDKFVVTTEFNWQNEDDLNMLYLTPGLVFPDVVDGWEFGIGASIGFSDAADTFSLMGMFTYEFDLFGDDED